MCEEINEFDICPYTDAEAVEALGKLADHPAVLEVSKAIFPDKEPEFLRTVLKSVRSIDEFQILVMNKAVEWVLSTTAHNFSYDGIANIKGINGKFLAMSNHRDIILDPAITQVVLYRNAIPLTEIAVGSNLLSNKYIEYLIRSNRMIKVIRGINARQLYLSSQVLSKYIRDAITSGKSSIWIAQREGRAKDSDDRTQDSVLKMLAMGGEGKPIDSLREINIVPLTISYEFDPCDYLKAQEFQQKRDNPAFKKSRQDDLDNMKTGIFGYKGRVHYHCAAPINTWIDELGDLPKTEFFAALSKRIDRELHANYCLFPCNYIALDELEGTKKYAQHYTEADKKRFEDYLKGQLEKVKIANPDEKFLRERMLTMYANPLRNYLKAKAE